MLPCEGEGGSGGEGNKKSQGNIFYCSERGQMEPNPKLAQEREQESTAEDQVLSALNNAGVSITK